MSVSGKNTQELKGLLEDLVEPFSISTDFLNQVKMEENSVDAKLARGETLIVGNKMYRVCPNCGKIVQINKPVLGSTHFCE